MSKKQQKAHYAFAAQNLNNQTQGATANAAPPDLFQGVRLEDYFDQVISRLPEVDEVLRRAGKTRADLVHVANDDEVMSATLSMYAAVVSTPMRLEGGKESEHPFFEAELQKTKSQRAWAAINAVLYGTSIFEAVYEDAQPITFKAFNEQSFKFFDVNRLDELRFYPSGRYAQGEVQDQQVKFCMTRWRNTAENPRGISSLSALFWVVFFRKNGWQFWVRFVERHASGLLVGYTNANDVEKMAQDLAAAINAGSYATNTDNKVESIKTGDGGQSYALFDDYLTKRVRLLLLGQTLTSDVGDKGSFAAAKVHKEVADDRCMILLDLAKQIGDWQIRALAMVNQMTSALPVAVYEKGEGLAIERVDRDCKAAAAGLYKPTDSYMRDYYGLKEGEYTIPEQTSAQPSAPSPDAASMAKMAALFAQFSAAQQPPRFDPQQQAVEHLVAQAMEQGAFPISDAELIAVIQQSTDQDDLIERLETLVRGKTQPIFSVVLERALNAADIMGHEHMRAS